MAEAIELVGAGTLGSDVEGEVRVMATSVTSSGGSGRMAWWVGDQGVKAAITEAPSLEKNAPQPESPNVL